MHSNSLFVSFESCLISFAGFTRNSSVYLNFFSDSDDMTAFLPYAYKLTDNGNSFITVAFGNANSTAFWTGDSFAFSSAIVLVCVTKATGVQYFYAKQRAFFALVFLIS